LNSAEKFQKVQDFFLAGKIFTEFFGDSKIIFHSAMTDTSRSRTPRSSEKIQSAPSKSIRELTNMLVQYNLAQVAGNVLVSRITGIIRMK
jgi:hypothetical protein